MHITNNSQQCKGNFFFHFLGKFRQHLPYFSNVFPFPDNSNILTFIHKKEQIYPYNFTILRMVDKHTYINKPSSKSTHPFIHIHNTFRWHNYLYEYTSQNDTQNGSLRMESCNAYTYSKVFTNVFPKMHKKNPTASPKPAQIFIGQSVLVFHV